MSSFRPAMLIPGSGISSRSLLCLVASVLIGSGWSGDASAASTVTTQTLKIQAGGADKANGDFLSADDTSDGTTGLNTYYSFFIEVPAGLSNLNVEIFDADFGQGAANDALRGNNFANSSTTYTLFNPASGQVATITGNNASPAAYNNSWTNLYSVAAPANGHWELRVDSSNSTGDDVNGFGIRAYNGAGNAGAGGIELPIYADTMVQIGNTVSNSSLTTRLYPWVTADCSIDVDDFDFDRGGGGSLGGSITVSNRLGSAVALSGFFSADNVWAQHTGANGDSTINRNAVGIWTSDIVITTDDPNNYANVLYGTTALTASPGARNPANSHRIYLPSDTGGAPVKPYMSQYYIYHSGTNPPANGSNTDVTVVIQVTNPTQRAITFSNSNLVRANLPANVRTSYQGAATVTQGAITLQPIVGGNGDINWNPGSLAAGATAVMTYRVRYNPNNGNTVVDVVGPFGANGTRATWLDETGSAQARATFAFGQLCGMTMTRGTAAPTPVSLASFSSQRDGDKVSVQWSTATETQNVGFRLVPEGIAASEQKALPLLPSHVVDSVEPQEYAGSLQTKAERIWLDDIDTRGVSKRHGPYTVGSAYGDKPNPEKIDWNASRRLLEKAGAVRRKSSQSAALLEVKAAGVHRVTYEQLVAAGVHLAGVEVASIALSNEQRPVARRIAGGAVFGPGSYIEFIGNPGTDLYGKTRSYLLSIDPARAVDVRVDNSRPAHTAAATFAAASSLDTQRYYSFASPNGDPWFADRMLAYKNSPVQLPIRLGLPARADLTPVLVKVRLWGVTDWTGSAPDHQLNVLHRGSIVAEWAGDGLTSGDIHAEVQPRKSNLLEVDLELTGNTGYDYDLVHIESVRAEYRAEARALDRVWNGVGIRLDSAADGFPVSGFDSYALSAYRQDESGLSYLPDLAMHRGVACCAVELPRGGDHAEYWVAQESSIAQPVVRALAAPSLLPETPTDYLIITHPLFAATVNRLAEHHRQRGLSVLVVDTDSIYRSLSDGAAKVQAIDDFIAYAATELGTRYVLLVGGDTYDYDDNLGLGSISFIPTQYRQLNEQIRYAPTDAPYADIDGDLRPDVALGRLPVRTPQELDQAIDKLLNQSTGGRQIDALFVAAAAEPGVDFAARAGGLRSALANPALSSSLLSVDSLGVERVRDRMQLALNTGPALVTYVGHSGVDRWSFDPLFTATEAATLGNSATPSVFIQWGCWNTYFVSPYFNSMAHALLFGSGGASSVIGAAALTDAAGHQALGLEMYPALASGARLGDALVQAKRAMNPDAAYFRETSLGVNLLGDPAATLF